MEQRFVFENISKFFFKQGLILCNYEGDELQAEIENFNISESGYIRNVLIKEVSTDRIFKCNIIAKPESLIVVQEKGKEENKTRKVYCLDEKWQSYMLNEYGWEYGSYLISIARREKKKIFDGFISLENDKNYISSRNELARRLANESRKEILVFSILGKQPFGNEIEA